jgi:hypothetical protein
MHNRITEALLRDLLSLQLPAAGLIKIRRCTGSPNWKASCTARPDVVERFNQAVRLLQLSYDLFDDTPSLVPDQTAGANTDEPVRG